MKMQFPIKSISDLETISNAVRWQYFEKLVAFVFEQNGFDVEQNVVLVNKNKSRRQYDVIAKRFGKTFVVECKKWKKGNVGDKTVEKHLDRCDFYEKKTKEKAVPLIVTLKENFTNTGEIDIVPVMKLNAFLNEFS